VDLITAPHQRSKQRWPKALRRWLASLRQIIETVNDKLLNTFRLARERPHDLRVCAERRKIADKKREREIEARTKSTEEEHNGQI
jgi:hypothetical protein